MAVASSSFQPSRSGFGSMFGAPLSGGPDREGQARAAAHGRPAHTAETVPPITRAPSPRRRRRTLDASRWNGREK